MQLNVLFGLPQERSEDERVLASFFKEEGKHAVCGGSTANRVAKYLGKEAVVSLTYPSDLPPTGSIEGVDLVTEGILTMGAVFRYLSEGVPHAKDGAVLLIERMQEASFIVFYVGTGEEKRKLVQEISAFFPSVTVREI